MNPYFSDQSRIDLLRLEASSWIGTGFRDHWATKGIGVDCVQLAAALYRECGLLENFQMPSYSIGAWKGLRDSPVGNWIESTHRFELLGGRKFIPGDLLCFAQGRVVYHLGIYLDPTTEGFIHSISVDGVCERTLHDPTWSSRLRECYRPVEE